MNLDNEYQLLKVFDELYVGLRDQGTGVNLGFATPFENNKAFEKRKSTVDRWARPYGKRVQKEDGEWEWGDGTPIPAITVKNDAVSGFKVADDVRRTYWGGGNVVWRIYDPRGYELEISSANLIRIIDSVGINAGGEIPVKCKWARLGANNILVPEGSDLWDKCIKDAETIKERSTTTSGFSAGDVVVLKNGSKCVYVGRFDVLIKIKRWLKSTTAQSYWRTYERETGVEYSLEKVGPFDVVVDFNADGGLSDVRVYSKIKVIKSEGAYAGAENLIDHVNSVSTYKQWAASTGKYVGCDILAVVQDQADTKLVYRQVTNVKLSKPNYGAELHPDYKRTWTAPYMFYFKDGRAAVLNDSSVTLSGYVSNRQYNDPIKYDGAQDIMIHSHSLVAHDDTHFTIHFNERPTHRFSGRQDLPFPRIVADIESDVSRLLPSTFEVGTMVDGKWVAVTK